jgi:hypothetical protein
VSLTNSGLTVGSGNLVDLGPVFSCGFDWHGVDATATAADGTPITSNTVDTPCG